MTVKDIWKDPVWSKVLGQGIIVLLTVIWGMWGEWEWPRSIFVGLCVVVASTIEWRLWFLYERRSIIKGGDHFYGRGRRRLLLIALLTVPVIAVVLTYQAPAWRSRWINSQQFTIYVARFENPLQPQQQQFRVTGYVVDGLKTGAQMHAGIKIIELKRFIGSQEEAQVALGEAKRLGARVMLWGDFYATGKAAVVSINVDVLSFDNSGHDLASSVTDQPSDFEEFQHFRIQQQLSKRMTGLTLAIFGIAKSMRGDYSGAASILEDALKEPDSGLLNPATLWLLRGTALNGLEKYSAGIDSLSEAIRLDPKSAQAHNNRGFALRRQGRVGEAIADFTTAIEENPKYSLAYLNRGYAHKVQGEYESALKDYNIAIDLAPGDPQFRINRGVLLSKVSHFEAAAADFTRAIELSPSNANAYQERAISYRQAGKPFEAIVDYNKVLHWFPDDSRVHLNRAIAYIELGEYKRAMQDLNRALDLRPDYALALANRASLRLQVGEYDQGLSDANRFFSIVDLGDPQQMSIFQVLERMV